MAMFKHLGVRFHAGMKTSPSRAWASVMKSQEPGAERLLEGWCPRARRSKGLGRGYCPTSARNQPFHPRASLTLALAAIPGEISLGEYTGSPSSMWWQTLVREDWKWAGHYGFGASFKANWFQSNWRNIALGTIRSTWGTLWPMGQESI